ASCTPASTSPKRRNNMKAKSSQCLRSKKMEARSACGETPGNSRCGRLDRGLLRALRLGVRQSSAAVVGQHIFESVARPQFQISNFKFKIVFLLSLTIVLTSGCTNVKPWQRGTLAEYTM